jgi:tRNA A37 methylthiotransferase MiaB
MQQMSSQPNSLSTILPILLNISTILEKLETRIDKIENIKKVKLESFSPSPDSDSETQGVIGDIRKLMKNIPNPFQYSSNY